MCNLLYFCCTFVPETPQSYIIIFDFLHVWSLSIFFVFEFCRKKVNFSNTFENFKNFYGIQIFILSSSTGTCQFVMLKWKQKYEFVHFSLLLNGVVGSMHFRNLNIFQNPAFTVYNNSIPRLSRVVVLTR